MASDTASNPTHDVLIIGAGPAGLSAAQQLMELGRMPVVLEAGDTAGWSWSDMPERLHLLSPWKVNSLPGSRVDLTNQHIQHSREEYYDYLRSYARRFDIDIRHGRRVEQITRDDEHFEVHTCAGESFRTRFVVNATGYFTNPHVPEWPGLDDTDIPWLHVADYKSPERLAEHLGTRSARVLIVGARVSAGQTMVELHDHPATDFAVELSRRTEIQFARPPWLQKLAFWGYYAFEDLQVLLDPRANEDSFPPMQGGRARRLIEDAAVDLRPDIARFRRDEVVFDDGSTRAYDAVVLATGYRPALEHLAPLVSPHDESGLPPVKDLESPETPGLFFVGLDQQRSFRSRYLRGIREDAALLAKKLDHRLAAQDSHQGKTYASAVEEVLDSVWRVGLVATVQLAASRLFDATLDAILGIDTSKRVTLDALDIDESSADQGQMYQPSGILPFLAIMLRTRLPDDAVFVDYGSGKGRTLLLAALLPVRRVIGIEFSAELCEVARANVEALEQKGLPTAPVDVVCQDAARYEYRDDENVFYFFYPFGQELMEQVIQGIEDSLRRGPREAVIVYYYPIHRRVIDDSELFELDEAFRVFGSDCLVYRSEGD